MIITFDSEQYALVGTNSQKLLQLGDEIYVKVKNADLVKKQLDFNFLRRIEEPLK
jgi:ribonuclease R